MSAKTPSYPRPDAYSRPGKVLGPLAEASNLSTPQQGEPLRDEADNRFLLLSTPPPTLTQNLDLCLGPRQRDKAAPREDVCMGNPSCSTLECIPSEKVLSPHIPYLSHSCTPTVKAEGKTAGTQCSSIIDPGPHLS